MAIETIDMHLERHTEKVYRFDGRFQSSFEFEDDTRPLNFWSQKPHMIIIIVIIIMIVMFDGCLNGDFDI